MKAEIDAVASGADADVIYTRSAELLREGAAISRAAFARIEALEAPGEDAGALDAWVAGNRRQAERTVALSRAFDAQDQTRIAVLSEEVDALEEANNATARKLGMRSCAERVQA